MPDYSIIEIALITGGADAIRVSEIRSEVVVTGRDVGTAP